MAQSNLDLLRYAKEAIRRNMPRKAEKEIVDQASEHGGSDNLNESQKTDKCACFLTGIAALDQKMDAIQAQLESMGVPEGIARHALIREVRVVEQARLLRCVNGSAEPPLPPMNYPKMYGWYLSSDLPENYSPKLAEGKEATELMLHEQTIYGVTYNLYGDPMAEKARMIGKQGNSRYAMWGTCGLCSTGNVLTMAGAEQAGEEDIINLAMHASEKVVETLNLFSDNLGNRGATTAQGRMELLQMAGLASRCLPIMVDRKQTMKECARLVREGYGVIVSVDVARFWRNGKGGHAVTLIAVTEDASTFFYCDTGKGCVGSISAKELGACLTGAPVNVTEQIIR